MPERILNLKLIDAEFGIVKLNANHILPLWATTNEFYSITRTEKEITIVCPNESIPEEIKRDHGWKCIMIDGSFEFNEIGIIASISNILAKNGISIYVISTYETDYVLIKKSNVILRGLRERIRFNKINIEQSNN